MNKLKHLDQLNQLTETLRRNYVTEKIELEESWKQKIAEAKKEWEERDQSVKFTPGVGTLPEVTNAFKLATQLCSQLKRAVPEIILLKESAVKLNKSLQAATKHNEEQASHLRDLVSMQETLGRQLVESEDACKQVLGQKFTVQNSEAEIQQCSNNISELTKKLLGDKTVDSLENNPVPLQEQDFNVTLRKLGSQVLPKQILENVSMASAGEPLFQSLASLSETLTQLQGCRFDGCTKLADTYTMLSKELSEQVTLSHNLNKEIEEMQEVCSGLIAEHQSKWMLRRGLEGDEKFMALPGVRSQLCSLLPEAQQAVMALMAFKVSTSSSSVVTTLPGSTASPCFSTTMPKQQSPLNVSVSNNNLCIECDERQPNVQFLPCGHIVLCSQCASVIRKCPQCRSPIHQKQQLLL
ncbi:hypothetical protein Pelo_3673 [Pelomyxa schiedti]|nr:hypothetical protein Pelo_3673 [Pelomyxa schiedti]